MKLRKIILPVVVLLLLCTPGAGTEENWMFKNSNRFLPRQNEQGNNIKITVQIEKGERRAEGS